MKGGGFFHDEENHMTKAFSGVADESLNSGAIRSNLSVSACLDLDVCHSRFLPQP